MPSLLFRQLTVLLNEPDNIYMRWHIPNSNNYATIFQFELSCFSLEITFNPSCRFISSKFLFKYMLSIQNNAMTQTDLNNKPLHILTVYGMQHDAQPHVLRHVAFHILFRPHIYCL